MKIATALMIVVMLSATAAAHTSPSREALAAMGLAEMRILTDAEASRIRGSGFNPAEKLAGFESYQQSKSAFQQRTAEFQNRSSGHTYIGAGNFAKSKASFRANVQKFQSKVH